MRAGPLVFPALAMAAGIDLARGGWPPLWTVGLACCVALAALALSGRLRAPIAGAVVLAPAFLFFGAFQYERWLLQDVPGDDLSRFAGQKVLFEGRIDTSPDLLPGQTVFDATADRILWGGTAQPATGRARVRVVGRRADLDCGQRVRLRASLAEPSNFGNPGDFDSVSYLRARGIGAKALVADPGWVEILDREPAASLPAAIERFRTRASRLLGEILPRSTAEIYKALIIGKESGIPAAQWRAFVETGTVHLLAISGMNVGIVSLVVYAGLRTCLLGIPGVPLRLNVTKVCAAASFFPALAYAAVAGWRVSTERSILMLGCYLGAVFLGREGEVLNALGLAAILCLARMPASLFEPGFQLSFVAVAALVVSGWPGGATRERGGEDGEARTVRPRWLDVPIGWLRGLALATLAAQLGTTPLTIVHFQTLVVLGMVANLVAIPLFGFLAVCPGLVGLLLMDIWPGVSELFFIAGGWVVGLGCRAVETIARLPLCSVHPPPLTLAEIAIAYAGIGAFFLYRTTRRGRVVVAASAVLLACAQLGRTAERAFHADLRVLFISVGQGDSTLVELPGGKTVLVDGGGWTGSDLDVGERIVVPFLRRRGIGSIDLMILSHPQWDHMGGLLAVAERMKVGEFWWSGIVEGERNGALDRLIGTLRAKGTPVREMGRDLGRLGLGRIPIEVLYPPRPPPGGRGTTGNPNDDSLVLRITDGPWSVLLTGDIEAGAEEDLVRSGKDLAAGILKVPHHGSPTSSTEAFVRAVHPSLAVVTTGSHPSARFPASEVVERYRSAGCEVASTGKGAIQVRIGGAGASWSQGSIRGWGPERPISGAVGADER